jgi:hypothetical protein
MATSAFGKAFRQARASGDKTFEWNGKKYTTALASATNPTAGDAKNKAEQDVADAIDPGDKRTREILKSRGSRPEAAKKPMSKEDYMQSREQYKQAQDESAPPTFRKGGYVKAADGIAQRGKTRGKMF